MSVYVCVSEYECMCVECSGVVVWWCGGGVVV